MRKILNIFSNNGGMTLIKKYFYNHVFLYAITLFLFLPKNRTGMELFREAINLKIFRKIQKKYRKYLNSNLSITENVKIPQKIWFCWLQGLEAAPTLVKTCYESIKKNCVDYEVIVIDNRNFMNYADIPAIILDKWEKGIISNTHFSDILRTALLVKNGGVWIDSTVLITSSIPQEIINSRVFLFQTYKPGSNGKAINLSSWFIASIPKEQVFEQVLLLLTKYWEKNNYLCDYFLFHIFVQIVLELNPEVRDTIPKYTNETPHFLLFELCKPFDKTRYTCIIGKSFCHKLTYKVDESIKMDKSNFYNWILENA